ncbi:MAG: exodeoxyribonuclease VII large subunit [Bacteroidales bacterium]|nr:exodeoxyribonuclease VII large subunit [Bacteroidales bacterium]
MEKEYMELVDLAALLKEGIDEMFPGRVWVKAEISSLSRKQNGHCYLDLSQSGRGGVLAKVRATIWASRWNYIDQYFKSVTGSSLEVGMEVLFRAQVVFHPVYGLSLDIDEVDPEFTLGAAERERQRTIMRLEEEGLIDLQKELSLPPLPYSLAVISAPGAAGYGDFMHHLLGNEYGFVFKVDFFEAVMQGQQAPESIMAALGEILTSHSEYDAVLILRGGGSDLDLACFDDYDLAAAIALCPVPVFTAIGHDKDYHVADMVANTFVKTPTALADLFLDCYIAEDQRISSVENRLRLAFSSRFSALYSVLDLVGKRITHAAELRLSEASHKLELLEARILSSDPRRILEKGFVLALDGKGVRMDSAASAKAGDPVRILFPDGTLEGTVTRVILSETCHPEQGEGSINPE